MPLRRVGFFFELPEDERHSALSRLRRSKGSSDEMRIINYLQSGVDAGVAMLVDHDLLVDPPKPLGEAILKSDGEWIWPASLAYYVAAYHVELPTEFVERMARNNWKVPSDVHLSPEVPVGHVQM